MKIEKEVIEKILDCKYLKYIELKTNWNDEQIKKIDKINYLVTKIKFDNVDKILINVLNKFINLNKFEYISFSNNKEKKDFQIKEDKNSKITKIKYLMEYYIVILKIYN